MTVPKYLSALGIVILVVLLIILALMVTNFPQVSTSTVSMNDEKEKLGTGTFVYIGSTGGNVTRVTIDTQNSYGWERILNNGQYSLHKGKYTIDQITSTQDPLYRLVNANRKTTYTQLSGTYYLTLDLKPAKFLLDTKNKSYELWSTEGQGAPLGAASTGESDYEIYVCEPQGRPVVYNATIEGTSEENFSSYSVTAQTPHVHKVTGRNVSAVFQKSGTDDAEMIVILFDPIADTVISRVTTNKAYGTVSLRS